MHEMWIFQTETRARYFQVDISWCQLDLIQPYSLYIFFFFYPPIKHRERKTEPLAGKKVVFFLFIEKDREREK